MEDKKLESLAYRLVDLDSLRSLFAHLNYNFADEPANKDAWTDDERNIIQEARVIAKKDDYKVYYLQTNTDSQKYWKGISAKIIKENHGLCMICSHNPSGFKWVFSSLSKDFSKSFTETRHVPIDIRPDIGVPQTFVEFLEKIKINKDSTASSIASQISGAFDSFAITIHNELTVNVFEALKSLSEGIILDESNGLTLDEETLKEIREPIFILLYRIIFILYAEDRGIFPVEQKIYYEKFSFKWLKQEWLLKSENQKLSEYQVHGRLWNFFRLIELGSEDLGYDSNEFFMRSYYGPIFDRNINKKLDKWKIKNQYLLDAISLLTRTHDKKGNYFFLDYSALETRHLGSIYEHLLEYHLTVKGKKIADLPNQQERKSSGSYYTPQYIVDYIVQNTIEPLIDKIRKDTNDKFEQIERILSLNILDPAMGSGHFLIGVVNYIAKRICEIEDGEITEQHLIERKRDVVRRCVYGVDINPLAVDLATVSLWLETLSSDKPLSFLNAHLKNGNSLIGTRIDVLFNKQTTLMESQKGREQFKRNIQDFIMFENLEDDSISAVKIKLEKYQKIQSKGTVYYNIQSLLDCKVAESFGLGIPIIADFKTKIAENSLDFFSDDKWEKIQNLSSNTKFFHWDLEFPDIFYDENGDKKYDGGFDCIIGNPPYTKIPDIKKNDKLLDQFLRNGIFESATGSFDLSALFCEQGYKLLNKNGQLGFIVTNTFFTSNYGMGLRKFLSSQKGIKCIINFDIEQVFKDASTYTAILLMNKKNNENFQYAIVKKLNKTIDQLSKVNLDESDNTIQCEQLLSKTLTEKKWSFIFKNEEKIFSKLTSIPDTLDDVSERISVGLQTSADSIYNVYFEEDHDDSLIKVFSKELNDFVILEKQILRKFVKGSKDIHAYNITYADRLIIFPYEKTKDGFKLYAINKMKKLFPKCFQYLKRFETKLKKRADCPKINWWGYTYPRNLDIFEKPKIMTPFNAFLPSFAFDKEGYCYSTGVVGGYAIITKPSYGIDSNYLIGLLNSILLGRYMISKGGAALRGGYTSYEDRFIKVLPIKIPQKKIDSEVKQISDLVESIEKLLDNANSENDVNTSSQIENICCKIDVLVFKLYNIDYDEMKLILNQVGVKEQIKQKIIEHFKS